MNLALLGKWQKNFQLNLMTKLGIRLWLIRANKNSITTGLIIQSA